MHREFATPAPAVSILTPAYDVARIAAAVPTGAAAGTRYPPGAMKSVYA